MLFDVTPRQSYCCKCNNASFYSYKLRHPGEETGISAASKAEGKHEGTKKRKQRSCFVTISVQTPAIITWDKTRTGSVGWAGTNGHGLTGLLKDISSARTLYQQIGRTNSLGRSFGDNGNMGTPIEIGNYRLLKTLGIGAFGKVKRKFMSSCCYALRRCISTPSCSLTWLIGFPSVRWPNQQTNNPNILFRPRELASHSRTLMSTRRAFSALIATAFSKFSVYCLSCHILQVCINLFPCLPSSIKRSNFPTTFSVFSKLYLSISPTPSSIMLLFFRGSCYLLAV